jgi:replicative DNA helicase
MAITPASELSLNYDEEMDVLYASVGPPQEAVTDEVEPDILLHQRLYEAILKLAERGQMAGPVTLKSYFEKEGDLTHVRGAAYLADLAASVITIINAEDYGRTIYDLYMHRELIALCQEVLRDAY